MIDFVTFGIILDDIVFPDGTTRMGVLGGGGPQTAWGMAAALRSGERVGLVAGVGRDLDERLLAPLIAAGIDLTGVRVTELPTPRAWQVTEADGRRTQVWRVPLESLGRQLARRWDVLPEAYRAAQHFHWGIHPDDPAAPAFAAELTARGRRVSLEPFRPPQRPLDDEALRALLTACAVFSPNWDEATNLTGLIDYRAMLERFRTLGGQILALRRGVDGADVWDLRAGRGVRVPAVQTQVVDAVGAGNAFCGALLAHLDEGLGEAACHAVVVASYLVEQVGLPAALPDPRDYARRLDEARAGLRPLTWPEQQ
ncbi:MAG: carbohydrate kinase family protein [Aggregatilineaceae bacterium]